MSSVGRMRRVCLGVRTAGFLSLASLSVLASQAPPGGNGPASDTAPDPGVQWSIFNHRGAGWFIFLWGLTALIAGLQWPKKTWWRFVPPMVLFGMVEFLFIRNDPEAWPTGPIGS